jgi:hypothetical protein
MENKFKEYVAYDSNKLSKDRKFPNNITGHF